MKLLTVLGARPQFIKAGPVSREIINRRQAGFDIDELIVHTGQHFDENMSEIFFREMSIPRPAFNLGISDKSHGAMTGRMLEAIERLLIAEQPDCVLVYGDTNSTLAGALAASKLGQKVAHVEAGLRSFNRCMPEEINRILTDRISELLFCPTELAMKNLDSEGIDNWGGGARSILTGDVMQDAAMFYRQQALKPERIEVAGEYILCTVHRAENTDDPDCLAGIFSALQKIAQRKQVIFPLHPRTAKALRKADFDTSAISFIEPVGYLGMMWLIDHCAMVMTDSGGLQKEAFFFAKPCMTLRQETEWVELVDHGYNVVAGTEESTILSAFEEYRFNTNFDVDLYGGGTASEKIVDCLLAGQLADNS